jgi:hypothetical protein
MIYVHTVYHRPIQCDETVDARCVLADISATLARRARGIGGGRAISVDSAAAGASPPSGRVDIRGAAS